MLQCLKLVFFVACGNKYPEVRLLNHMAALCYFVEDLHTVFQLTFPPKLHKDSLCSTSSCGTCVLYLTFLIIAILTVLSWYLNVVLICISLMGSYVEHLFIYLLANSLYLENVYSDLLLSFFFFFACLIWVLYIQAYFILLHFTDTAFFFFLHKLKFCGNIASGRSVDTIFHFVQFLSLCHILVILAILQTFSR